MVLSLWAIMITVLFFESSLKEFCTRYSFSGSAKAVASSSTTIGASFRIARAIAIRCCSPPERYTPFAPMTVWMPSGSFSIISVHCAFSRASMTSCSVASGRDSLTFSRTDRFRSLLSWNTYDTVFINSSFGISLTFTPPIFTAPFCTSQKRAISPAAVVFPPPEGPTSASEVPLFTLKLTLSKASFSPS